MNEGRGKTDVKRRGGMILKSKLPDHRPPASKEKHNKTKTKQSSLKLTNIILQLYALYTVCILNI